MAQLRFSSKKVKPEMFWEEFQRHQEGGYIGDPAGEEAYGYLRVSTDRQTEDWKTGIMRQIENLHIAAQRDGLRISWDMIFGDDESGYLLDRPALKELLIETATAKKTLWKWYCLREYFSYVPRVGMAARLASLPV